MDISISKFRQKRILQRSATPEPHPSFRRGPGPTIIYTILFVLLASTLLFLPSAATPWPVALGLVVALVLLCAGCLLESLRSLHPEKTHRSTHLCLLYTMVVVALLIGAPLCYLVRSTFGEKGGDLPMLLVYCLPILLPHLIAPVSLSLLLGPVFGTLSGIALAQLFSLQLCLCFYNCKGLDEKTVLLLGIATLVTGLVTAAVVPRCIRCGNIRRPAHVVKISLVALAAPLAGFIVAGLLAEMLPNYSPDSWEWFAAVAIAVVSCFFQTIVVAGTLFIFEHIFALTSDIRLQNFADLSEPLMVRLAAEAPGTLSHSSSVSTIAAKAADCIGANPILARVGAYYHDIGKLVKPAMFSENQVGGVNPHDTLPAATSAMWLRNHVKDGLAFAKEYNLPIPIRKLIAEHHGTTLMAFFYHKAKQEAKAAAEAADDGRSPAPVEEGLYRYSGPKPSSKEAGILMLADSVEAAARSLDKPTPQAIESLVTDIFQKKLLDGQFDECPLSMAELVQVRTSIATSLISILHTRVVYPKDDADAKPAAEVPADAKPEEPASPPDETPDENKGA